MGLSWADKIWRDIRERVTGVAEPRRELGEYGIYEGATPVARPTDPKEIAAQARNRAKATYTPPPQPFDPDDGYIATGKGAAEAAARIGATIAGTTGGLATIAAQTVDIFNEYEIERKFRESGATFDFGGAARRAFESSDLPTKRFTLPAIGGGTKGEIMLPFGRSLRDIDIGAKGAIEAFTDPFNLIGVGPAFKGFGAVARGAARTVADPSTVAGRAVRAPAYAAMGVLPDKPQYGPRAKIGSDAVVGAAGPPEFAQRLKVAYDELAAAQEAKDVARYGEAFKNPPTLSLAELFAKLPDKPKGYTRKQFAQDLFDAQKSGADVVAGLELHGPSSGAARANIFDVYDSFGNKRSYFAVSGRTPAQPVAAAVPSTQPPRPPPARGQGPPPKVPPAAAAGGGQPLLPQGSTTTVKQRPTSWFKLEPFDDPANRLVGPQTGFERGAARTKLLRQVQGVIDPASIHNTEPAANLGIRKMVYEETQKSRAHAAVAGWWADAKPLFGFDDKGVARKVKLAPGAGMVQSPVRGTIMDIVENPLRYDLTPRQQTVLDDAQALMDSVLASEKAAGVQVNELADYWARIVTDSPAKQRTLLEKLKQATSGPTMPGSKGHTKARTFDFAEDTVNAGFTISTDPVQTLTNRLDAGIQAISNREATVRTRALPGVHFGAPSFGEGQVLSQFNPNAIQVWSAPRETIQEIQKWIDLPEFKTPGGNRLAQEALQAYRAVLTSIDLGSATLQTGRTAWRNPAAWIRAVAAGAQALFQEPVSYFAANQQLIDRGIKNGAIVPPSEFLFPNRGLARNVAGITKGTAETPLGKIYTYPSGLLRASNRFMQWNIFVAQTELYKAAEGLGGKGIDELVSLGKAIRHQTGTESYAVLGVRGTQRDLEAIVLFAPRFFRAISNEIGQAFTGGPGGQEARRSLGTALAGMTALTVAANYAQGRSTNFTDARREDWARFKVGDSWVSAYGPLHNYFRTAARMAYYLTQEETDPISGKPERNPEKAWTEAVRFAKSKQGIGLALITIGGEVAYTGESSNFDGAIINYNPLTWRHALNWPITPENVMTGLAEGRAESLLNITNTNINPETPGYTWRQYVEAETGTPIDLLDWQTRRYYKVQDKTGRALNEKRKERFESAKPGYEAAQEFKETAIRQQLDYGMPVSVMLNDLDFIRDSFVKPPRVKDELVRQAFAEFLAGADYVESTGYWDLVKQVKNYGIPDWQQDYEQWKGSRGIPEAQMGMSPAQLGHAKVIQAELDALEEKAKRGDPILEQHLVTFYDQRGESPAGIMLMISLHEQRAEAVRRKIEAERVAREGLATRGGSVPQT